VRIVSLLPSTTEILFAIGAGPDVVGVTFECDFPAEARNYVRGGSSSSRQQVIELECLDDEVLQDMLKGDDPHRSGGKKN
jgi:iron complex transport system substrate-binding protein